MVIFRYNLQVHIDDTDLGGSMFFANFLRLAHRAFELFCAERGYSAAEVLQEGKLLLAVVHTEAQFKKPLYPGDTAEVSGELKNFGKTSFTFYYDIFDSQQNLAAEVKITHVCIDPKSGDKIPIPGALKDIFCVTNPDEPLVA